MHGCAPLVEMSKVSGGSGSSKAEGALANLARKTVALKTAAASAVKQEGSEKNHNVPFVKMNGDDWVCVVCARFYAAPFAHTKCAPCRE